MSNYFDIKGSVWYTLDSGEQVLMNDLTTFATFDARWRNDVRTQLDYKIKDGDLPHMISHRLYDTVDYWWVILLLNNIYDFDNQWPRTYGALHDYIARKYPGKNPNDVHHYIDGNGLVADLLSAKIEYGLQSDAEAIDAAGLEPISIEEFETAMNETKRNIKLIDPDYISAVYREYEDKMKSGA